MTTAKTTARKPPVKKALTEEQRRAKEMEAYKRLMNILDGPLPDVTLEAKTYTDMSEVVQLAAIKLINCSREDKMLNALFTAVMSARAARCHPELMDEYEELEDMPKSKRHELVIEGVEVIFAQAMSYVREGMDALDDLERIGRMTARGQAKRIAELEGSEDWELLKESDNFNTGTLNELMDKVASVGGRSKGEKANALSKLVGDMKEDDQPVGYL